MTGEVKVEYSSSSGGGNGTTGNSPPPPGFSGTSSPVPPQLLFADSGGMNRNHGTPARGEAVDDERSESYTNLAAALGSGLVESMEDATRADLHNTSTTTRQATTVSTPSSAGPVLLDSFFNPGNDLAYERHKRHAASRLLGTSSPGSYKHRSQEPGFLFGGTFDNPSSLMGGGNGNKAAGVSSLQAAATAAYPHDPNAPPFRPSHETSSSFDGPSNGRFESKSKLNVTKDLGLTVIEPAESPFRGRPGNGASPNLSDWNQNESDDGTFDITRGIRHMRTSDGGRGPRSGSRSPIRTPGSYDAGTTDATEDLRPFTWDINHHEPSRTLVVLGAFAVNPNDVRSICESFGVIESFRSDFVDRGIVLVSFFDMRCAQFAAMQLPVKLPRMVPGADRVQVKFCVPLNSSAQNDESLVVINDLPAHISVDDLAQILSSFGAIRSLKKLEGSYGGNTFEVEYHDIQDARQVVLELDSTQPWGPDVSVEVGSRNPHDRKKGRELLALLGRWRGQGGTGTQPGRGRPPSGIGPNGIYRPHGDPRGAGHRDTRYERGVPLPQQHSSQLVLGPDGRYTYGTSYEMHAPSNYSPYVGMSHVVHSGHGVYVPQHHQPPGPPSHHQQNYYPSPQRGSHYSAGSSVMSGGSHNSGHRIAPGYFSDDRSVESHRSAPTHIGSLAGSTSDGQNQHLMLDLDAVESGTDTRTSLMVRNIPNKYTQQMLLTEFAENGHGPGVIDFFYLPIDFKNRCNRGYAFINFVDFRDILMFHRQYYGKHWRTFNSDKICDITYARIQGKAAMLKRFENSALMEKDEEYKPLVFVSEGPDKGKRLPFSDPSNKV